MPPSGPGTIYPFADKCHFDNTYRAICAHKNISLDLSRLVVHGTSLDLHQLHLLVFKSGGEFKVNEKDLWGDVALEMGFNDPFSPSAAQRSFSDSRAEKLDRTSLNHSPSPSPSSSAAALPLSTTTPTTTSTTTAIPSPLETTEHSTTTISQHLSRVYKLYLTFFDQAIQENIAQNRARAQAEMKATAAQAAKVQANAQATAQATAQAQLTHTLIPHGIPLTQFLTQYVGLQQTYVDTISAQEQSLLLEWTQMNEGELRSKMKVTESVVGVVGKVRDKLKEMREGTSTGVRERPGFTTSVTVGIVLPGSKPNPPPPPPSAPPIGPVPPIPEPSPVPPLPTMSSSSSQAGVKFISSGLKGEPLPPPEPKMGSKSSFEVVYRLLQECKITEASLDNSMDSIIVPAEKLPEHHALLDKVSQACAEIDTKLAMIHDVLQQENYIKRMIIISLLTKEDWERRYVLSVDMLKSMLAEIQYLVGLYNQKIRGLMDAFQSTVSQLGHDAAVQQLPAWVQVQLQQQAREAAMQPPPPLNYTPEEYAAMAPEERQQARQMQRAQEAEAEIVKFKEGYRKEGPEEMIRWIENRCRPLKNLFEEYLEQRKVLEDRLREREREREEEEEEKRYSAMGRRRWSLREEDAALRDAAIAGGMSKLPFTKRTKGGGTTAATTTTKSEWSIDGALGLPFTEEEHAAAVLFSLVPCGYVLSYQQHVFATGTKRYILTLDQLEEWVEDYADIIEEFIERKNAMHREQVESHMRSIGRILDLSGVDIGALAGTGARKNRSKNNKKKKKKKFGGGGGEEVGEEEEEERMADVLVGVVDFLEMYRSRI
ncbi:hypothetical protein AGABI2DRAFT_179139 [Agaricus bisporus var. bisporus H97]|uniref:hypothetical protein n=1 Tax=Agaricus bisporus var. bisporus (strain H97 / ATCC MYA-4626 / FGSC 10389) TaxID=936046 RepID=UPI00029F6604|nr:hypothetical protein AGABI2DRAFT_179139 [Agaricus bisporus var. bisporus H97]EKV45557.1 hypothetical protein AGABI2DRAFT_179139 [Agaricus bisporus var. bisporus H97]